MIEHVESTAKHRNVGLWGKARNEGQSQEQAQERGTKPGTRPGKDQEEAQEEARARCCWCHGAHGHGTGQEGIRALGR